MAVLQDGLAAAGHPVLAFDYPYFEAGRRAPDRMEVLLAAHRAAAERLAGYAPQVVLAGKSMGGRMGSHLVGDGGWLAAGLVYYGYPLVPQGTKPARPVDHLERIQAPQLFFAGTRDRLSPPRLVGPIVARLPRATLVAIEGADHGFRRSPRSGDGDVMARLVAETVSWLAALERRYLGGER